MLLVEVMAFHLLAWHACHGVLYAWLVDLWIGKSDMLSGVLAVA